MKTVFFFTGNDTPRPAFRAAAGRSAAAQPEGKL